MPYGGIQRSFLPPFVCPLSPSHVSDSVTVRVRVRVGNGVMGGCTFRRGRTFELGLKYCRCLYIRVLSKL